MIANKGRAYFIGFVIITIPTIATFVEVLEAGIDNPSVEPLELIFPFLVITSSLFWAGWIREGTYPFSQVMSIVVLGLSLKQLILRTSYNLSLSIATVTSGFLLFEGEFGEAVGPFLVVILLLAAPRLWRETWERAMGK